MIAGDEDVGEGFVIPHQHIVTGAQLLDVIRLKQQRLGLRLRDDEFHRAVSAIIRAMRLEWPKPRV